MDKPTAEMALEVARLTDALSREQEARERLVEAVKAALHETQSRGFLTSWVTQKLREALASLPSDQGA